MKRTKRVTRLDRVRVHNWIIKNMEGKRELCVSSIHKSFLFIPIQTLYQFLVSFENILIRETPTTLTVSFYPAFNIQHKQQLLDVITQKFPMGIPVRQLVGSYPHVLNDLDDLLFAKMIVMLKGTQNERVVFGLVPNKDEAIGDALRAFIFFDKTAGSS